MRGLGNHRFIVVSAGVAVSIAAVVSAFASWPSEGSTPSSGTADSRPFPLDERLTFDIRYLGIHCGQLVLTSFARESEDGAMYHIVATARSSKFFDGIYRVRVRLESVYSGDRESSISYHHHGQEKKETKDELWIVDFDAGQVIRTRNGEEDRTIAIESDHVHDPLAFLYRMRDLLGAPGDQATLAMMTSDGDVETVAEVVEQRRVKTPFGKRDALIVVPYPKDDQLFTKKGKMQVWVSTDGSRLPYRVIFDLPFGKLVAKLERVEESVSADDCVTDGES